MKKVIFGLVALFASSVALATGVGAGSSSFSGTHASTNAVGGGYSINGSGAGYSYQGSIAGAENTTSAGAYSNGDGSSVEVGAGVYSSGSTYSYSGGIQDGAGFGETSGLSIQGGIGEANAYGKAFDSSFEEDGISIGWGGAKVDAFAAQISGSATSNTANGSSGAVSSGHAYSSNIAGLSIHAGSDHVTVNHRVDSVAEAGGLGNTRAEDGGSSIAGGIGYAEGGASTWADTYTYSYGGGYPDPDPQPEPEPEPEPEPKSKGNNGFGNGPDGSPPGHFNNGGGAHRGQDDPN